MLNTIEYTCDNCTKIFKKQKYKNNKNNFCSTECYKIHRNKNHTTNRPCTNCNILVNRILSEVKSKNGNIFCSRSCSSTWHNINTPRKRLTKKCKKCNNLVYSNRVHCESCNNKDINLKEAIYIKHHRSSAFSLVRLRARKILKKLNIKICQSCSYDKHIEACHIKAIKTFSLESKISEINAKENILGLCRNCHWELDNDLLDINDLLAKSKHHQIL